MEKSPEIDVWRRIGELIDLLRSSEDFDEWANISTELTLPLIVYWDHHPHSAMEMLEQVVISLPIDLAKPVVHKVVSAWKRKSNYNPDAGGSADHCYLSALILSDNLNLAEESWVEKVLPKTLGKESYYKGRIRDYERKLVLIRAAQHSSRKPSKLRK